MRETEGSQPQPQSEHPPPLKTESLHRRFKPIWRTLLIFNLALGAYMFTRAKRKSMNAENSKAVKKSAEDKGSREMESSFEDYLEIAEMPSSLPEVIKEKEPIPEDQQRELFKWMLEEKRKVKPKDPEEKKRIDEEKAILKQFIHAKSIPRI
ncbi:hypothetical protein K2173_011759 [Erythroxylum novogranatense]|uniref:Transmembrane protein n=1 Tax=Erythroxylum novogranatense TaxID=1862640 RepID=A0AAV8TJ89_9ROSI|nr:hypothetical protein K2173_011759 [Erythroxylum novogranatense]